MPAIALWKQSTTYFAAIAGGAIFASLGIPLPWMFGPLLVTALLSLWWGAPYIPFWARPLGQMIVACAIAINLTPSALVNLLGNTGPMIAAGAGVIMASLAISWLLMRISGIDRATVLFATLPGGPAEMATLAEKHGGQSGLVALVQTFRIALVVTVIPTVLALSGAQFADITASWPGSEPAGIVLVLAVGLLSALLFHRLRIVNAFFLGPLLAVGLAALVELPVSPLPWSMIVIAQFALGISLGSAFTRGMFAYGRSFILHASWTTLLLILVTFTISATIASQTGDAMALLILANAPGGAPEMGMLAKTLDLDAALVTAYHLIRLLMITPSSQLIFRLFRRVT